MKWWDMDINVLNVENVVFVNVELINPMNIITVQVVEQSLWEKKWKYITNVK